MAWRSMGAACGRRRVAESLWMRPGISWGGPGDSPHTPAASTVPEDFKSSVPHVISAPGREDNPVLGFT